MDLKILVKVLTIFIACNKISEGLRQASTCYMFGTQHIFTYDKQRIDFQTNCQLQLSRTCTGANVPALFSIEVINERKYLGDDSPFQAYCVKVLFNGIETVMCTDQSASVDGQSVETIMTSNDQLAVYQGIAGRELTIQRRATSPPLVVVTITRSAQVKISISKEFSSRVCGLCGNSDGNPSNDLFTRLGNDLSNLSPSLRGAQIVQSYLVATRACPAGTIIKEDKPSSCSTHKGVEQDLPGPTACGAYDSQQSIFSDCPSRQPELTRTFREICGYDYCHNYLFSESGEAEFSGRCPDCVYNETVAKEAINAIAEVYADICRVINRPIPNWRAEYDAGLKCGRNEAYVYNGQQCPNACGLQPGRCTDTDVEGCTCSAGKVRDNGVCVDPSLCGCVDTEGEYHTRNSWWINDECSVNSTCAGGTIAISPLFCSEHSDCTFDTQHKRACRCKEKYEGDGIDCQLVCLAGSEPNSDSTECILCEVGFYKERRSSDVCVKCPSGQITPSTGSKTARDCTNVNVLPDSEFAIRYTYVADQSFGVTVSSNILPSGLPVGSQFHRRIWVSTNGIVTFGIQYPGTIPQNVLTLRNIQIAAVFWLRQDFRVRAMASPLAAHNRLSLEILNNPRAEMVISEFNKIDRDAKRRLESESIFNFIKTMMATSNSYSSITFEPTYALLVTWQNSVPNPAAYYAGKEAMTYQCIIASNGARTFVFYIYPPNGLALNLVQNRRRIFMGINAQDNDHQYSYPFSDTPKMASIDIDPSNTVVNGRWVFELANLGEDNPSTKQCLEWYNVQKYIFPIGIFENLGDPCPCNRGVAIDDERFFYEYSEDCAYSLNRKLRTGFFQRCCYSRALGSLLIDDTGGAPVQYSPLLTPAVYEAVDRRAYENCCKKSKKCDLFREYRPVDDCLDYRPPRIGTVFGDPHILTLDGEVYTFNPVGEFWLIKSADFSAQSRMVQALTPDGNLAPATQFQAFTMRALQPNASSTVQLEIDNNRTDFEVRVDGLSVSGKFNDQVVQKVYQAAGVTIKKFNNSITVTFNTGHSFRFSLRFQILSMQYFVPDTQIGQTSGLLGNFDADKTNELISRNRTEVCKIGETNCTLRTIHYEFGETWRITPEESLFKYREGWDWLTFNDLSFVPKFDIPTGDARTAVCNNNFQCIFDVTMTNNTALGEYSTLVMDETIAKSKVLESRPPNVIGPKHLNVKVGQTITVTYAANFSGNGTYIIRNMSLPENATLRKANDTYLFTWTPTSLKEQKIQLVAEEESTINSLDQNVSPVFDVLIKISRACKNGSPSWNTIAVKGAISENFIVVTCECANGWEGEECEIDYNGCLNNPCKYGECVDIPAPEYIENGTTYFCNVTDCPTGYEELDSDCLDINECLNASRCNNGECINTDGSFTCSCNKGYIKSSTPHQCDDINECELNMDDCSQLCRNTNGSFICECFPNFLLAIDNTTCKEIKKMDACDLLNCSFACVQNSTDVNRYHCICPRGKQLAANGSTCEDINECATGVFDCPINSTCKDQLNGYSCECQPIGFQPATSSQRFEPCLLCEPGRYGHNCNETCLCGDRAKECNPFKGCIDCSPGWTGEQCLTDINECEKAVCGENSQCTNTNGSYYCDCNEGFSHLNTTTCVDVDECLTLNPCSKLAICTNTVGSYKCTCIEGYTGNGLNCADIDECRPANTTDFPCHSKAFCRNELGSYSCQCLPGYYGDGLKMFSGCMNENECQTARNVCPDNSKCVDTDGSYQCECDTGFYDSGTAGCLDIDECNTTHNCSDKLTSNGTWFCNNTKGSYECVLECNRGYRKENDKCIQIDECSGNSLYSCPDNSRCRDTEGSYDCDCFEGFIKNNTVCEDVNECLNSSLNNCTSYETAKGSWVCSNTKGGFECVLKCDSGYRKENTSCVQINECEQSSLYKCPDNSRCRDTEGSYECDCLAGFIKNNTVCEDVNECLNSSLNDCSSNVTPNGSWVCYNTIGDYDCLLNCGPGLKEENNTCQCESGYEGANCTAKKTGYSFLLVIQAFELPFEQSWSNPGSDGRFFFDIEIRKTLSPIYNVTKLLRAMNIKSVSLYRRPDNRNVRAAGDYTDLSYELVFTQEISVADVIQRSIYQLAALNSTLTFNESSIRDLGVLSFPEYFNRSLDCESTITVNGTTFKLIDCHGQGECQVKGYPICVCDDGYEGYNCDSVKSPIEETSGANLLALWISVAIAGALLLGGLLACAMVLIYQKRQRSPALHRFPRPPSSTRGPSLFNPTTRMPTEAYNYQFPVGSIRDDSSDTYSTVSSSSSRSRSVTEGRVGSTVPYAPRWPKAYYAQMGDPDDN